MKTNKLSVNISKTYYIIFRPKQKSISMNLPLKSVNVVNENISWKCHIDHVCNNISKSIGMISRSRFVLSTRTKLSLYFKNEHVRVMTNSGYRAHSAPLFEQLKVLDIFKVNTFHIAKFMFLYHHQLLPVSLSNLFVTNNQVHGYYTRNANSYRPHHCGPKNIKQFTILYQGPNIWNSLPFSIKSSNSLHSFKKILNCFLLNK